MNFTTEDGFVIENNVIKVPSTIKVERGLGCEVFKAMKKFKDKVAQFLVDENETDTYGELLKRCVRCALKMREKGLRKGDLISICTYNHKNTCVPVVAALFLGVRVSSVDTIVNVNDMTYLLKEITPKQIFLISDAVNLVEQALIKANLKADLTVFDKSEKYEQFSSYLEPIEGEDDFTPDEVESLDETAMVFFSSGTTGLPKAVCVSHRAAVITALRAINMALITSVTMLYSKFSWISIVTLFYSSILSGSSLVVSKAYDPKTVFNLIDKYKASFLFLVPTQATDLCKAGRPEGLNTSSLRCLLLGGYPMPLPYLAKIKELFPETVVSETYGISENAGITTCFSMNRPRDMLLVNSKPNCCGRPVEGIWYKVTSLDTNEPLGPNERGELRIKSSTLLTGYYKGDCSEEFDEDGWLKTGDVLYYDKDYCFFVVDRLKQLIRYRLQQVPPILIENVLEQHPAVQMVVVIGIPHDEDDERPMAVIKLNDGYKTTAPEEFIKFVEDRMHDSQRLRGGVRFVETFPLTPSGKVKRIELRRMILNN